jgi:DNA-binding MarR family transcriptional regulator
MSSAPTIISTNERGQNGRKKSREDGTNNIPRFDPRVWPMAWLIRVERQHMLNASAVLAKNGLTHREFRLLIELSISEGSGVADMAEATTSERSTTSRVVERLIRQGLVERKSSSSDQRRTPLFLTHKGREKIKHSVPLILDLFREYEADLPREDMEVLVTSLQRLDTAVRRVARKLKRK